MTPVEEAKLLMTRRHFFSRGSTGLGLAALGTLLSKSSSADIGLTGLPHFAPKAKRVIYLFQHGGPSQMDLFDYKPSLEKRRGADLPVVLAPREGDEPHAHLRLGAIERRHLLHHRPHLGTAKMTSNPPRKHEVVGFMITLPLPPPKPPL